MFWLIYDSKATCYGRGVRPEPESTEPGQTEVEWEEALFMAWGAEMPMHPSAYYRRKAARAREIAEEVTTRVMQAKLLDEAARYDQLAAEADRVTEEAAGF
jgi:hypothetical protein